MEAVVSLPAGNGLTAAAYLAQAGLEIVDVNFA